MAVLLVASILVATGNLPFADLSTNGTVEVGFPSNFGVSTTVKVTVKDQDGNVKAERFKDNDLITTNFARIIGGFFITAVSGSSAYVLPQSNCLKQVSGAWVSNIAGKGPTTGQTGPFSLFSTFARDVLVRMGTGTNSPAVGDYVLQTPVESYEIISTGGYYNATTGNITFTAVSTFTSSYSITEVGIYFYAYIGGTGNYFLLMRDTFGAVSVVSSDTITCEYTIVVGNYLTDNFGKILAAFLTRTKSEITTLSLTDTAGASYSTNAIGDNVNNWLFDTNAASPLSSIRVGTTNTTFTKADYTLASPVESYAEIGTSLYEEGSLNQTFSATVTMTADRTINEAGIFAKGKDTGGSDRTFMLARVTFNGVTVDNTRQVTISLKIYYNV